MLEERPKIIATISNYIKAYSKPIIVIVVLAIAFQGWRVYQKHLTNTQTELQKENEAIKIKIATMTKEYNDLANSKKEVELNNAKLDADAQYWKNKANSHKVLPPPGPAPVDDVKLVSDLKDAGVEFKPLSGAVFSTERSNLPVIWTWNKQALRVPELEATLADTIISAKKFEDEATGLKREVEIDNGMLKKAAEIGAEHYKLEETFSQQLKQKDKLIWSAEVNGWVKVGITIPVVYGITRLIHK
jgi:hypothetical protein